MEHDPEPISVNLDLASRMTCVSRSTIEKAIRKDELRSCRIGKRRIIMVDDLKAWIRHQEEAMKPKVSLS